LRAASNWFLYQSCKSKPEEKMASENMIEGGESEGSARNRRARHEEGASDAEEDLKSAASAVAEDYTKKGSKALNEAKERVGALRDNGEDYVRENPMKAVFTALGVGFMLGFIFRR